MAINLKGNNESSFSQNIKTAKKVEVTDGIVFGDGTLQTTAAGGGGGDSTGYGADAWGRISDQLTILNGKNVDSVADLGGGDIQVNFITPMPNANYAVTADCNDDGDEGGQVFIDNITVNGFVANVRQTTGEASPNRGFGFAVFASNAIAPQAGVGADAWANVEKNTANGGNYLDGSFNIASVTRVGLGVYDVVFTTSMPSTDYAPLVSAKPDGNKNVIAQWGTVETDGFRVILLDPVNDVNIDSAFTLAVFASSTITPTFTWTRQGTTLLPANAGDDVVVGDNKLYGSFGIDIDYGSVTNTYGLRLKGDDDSNKIRLNTDGSITATTVITAAGAIQSGGSPYSGANVGSIIENGGVVATKTTGTDTIWAGYTTGNSDPTSKISANGNVLFAGRMEVGDDGTNDANILIRAASTSSGTALNVITDGVSVADISTNGSCSLATGKFLVSTTGGLVTDDTINIRSRTTDDYVARFVCNGGSNNVMLVEETSVTQQLPQVTAILRISESTNGNSIAASGDIRSDGNVLTRNVELNLDPDNSANYDSNGHYTGAKLDMKKVGLALTALKATAAASSDFATLKSAIATALADL